MENRQCWSRMLVMLLVFVFIIGRVEAQTDSRLNGTWVCNNGAKIMYNNGIFEEDDSDGPFLKGTYTTSGNTLTYMTTHFYGAPLSAQWHTASETISRLRNRSDNSNYSDLSRGVLQY